MNDKRTAEQLDGDQTGSEAGVRLPLVDAPEHGGRPGVCGR